MAKRKRRVPNYTKIGENIRKLARRIQEFKIAKKSPHTSKTRNRGIHIQQMPIFRFLCGTAYKKNKNEYSLVFSYKKTRKYIVLIFIQENTRNIQEIQGIIPTAEMKQRGSGNGFLFIYTQQLRSQTFAVDFIYVLLNAFLCGARHNTHNNMYGSTYIQHTASAARKVAPDQNRKKLGFRAKMQYGLKNQKMWYLTSRLQNDDKNRVHK